MSKVKKSVLSSRKPRKPPEGGIVSTASGDAPLIKCPACGRAALRFRLRSRTYVCVLCGHVVKLV